MGLAIRIHVEELPEAVYLASSDELPGSVAQGRTVPETLEIARDIARKLQEGEKGSFSVFPLSSGSYLLPSGLPLLPQKLIDI
jgi:predicted RNase H-like HicB family nuclease